MLTVHVNGLSEVNTGIKNLPKQARFALGVAVNETAKVVQAHTLKTLLPSKFILRSRGAPWQRPGTRMGFNINFAKRSQVNPQAVVGSRADWLPIQEEGGIKDRPKAIAIPTSFHKVREEILARGKRPKAIAKLMNRRDSKRKIDELNAMEAQGATGREIGWQKIRNTKETKRRRAARSSLRNTPFYLGGFNTPEGHAFPSGWWVRTSKERLPIRPLFFFHETTRIQPTLEFIPTETRVANQELLKQFQSALNKAIATAK